MLELNLVFKKKIKGRKTVANLMVVLWERGRKKETPFMPSWASGAVVSNPTQQLPSLSHATLALCFLVIKHLIFGAQMSTGATCPGWFSLACFCPPDLLVGAAHSALEDKSCPAF